MSISLPSSQRQATVHILSPSDSSLSSPLPSAVASSSALSGDTAASADIPSPGHMASSTSIPGANPNHASNNGNGGGGTLNATKNFYRVNSSRTRAPSLTSTAPPVRAISSGTRISNSHSPAILPHQSFFLPRKPARAAAVSPTATRSTASPTRSSFVVNASPTRSTFSVGTFNTGERSLRHGGGGGGGHESAIIPDMDSDPNPHPHPNPFERPQSAASGTASGSGHSHAHVSSPLMNVVNANTHPNANAGERRGVSVDLPRRVGEPSSQPRARVLSVDRDEGWGRRGRRGEEKGEGEMVEIRSSTLIPSMERSSDPDNDHDNEDEDEDGYMHSDGHSTSHHSHHKAATPITAESFSSTAVLHPPLSSQYDRSPQTSTTNGSPNTAFPYPGQGIERNGTVDTFHSFVLDKQGKKIRRWRTHQGQNTWYLSGLLLTSGDSKVPLLLSSLFAVAAPALFFVFNSSFFWSKAAWGKAALLVAAYATVLMWSSMARACTTDPGILPRNLDVWLPGMGLEEEDREGGGRRMRYLKIRGKRVGVKCTSLLIFIDGTARMDVD
ncbi:hypothetical protein BT69DRAFT_331735 [Atractiella rhizophila]|nr:hypothetical protein BT69DRAFT_331735 [Atractiella rhizophila]